MKKMPSANFALAALALSGLFSQAALAAPVALPGDLASWTCTGICAGSTADGDITLSPLNNARYGYVTTSGSDSLGVSPLSLVANSRGDGTETNGSRIVSTIFAANTSDALNVYFNYISTDGKGFDDYAWGRVLNANDNSLVAWLFTARSSNSATGNIVPGDVVTKKEFDPRNTITNYDSFNFTSKTTANPVDWSPLGFSNGSCWKDNAAGCGFTGWLQSSYSFASSGNFKLEFGVTNWGDGAYDSGLAFDFQNLAAASISSVPEPSSYAMTLLGLGFIGFATRRTRKNTQQ
jgi:hypothetical protein